MRIFRLSDRFRNQICEAHLNAAIFQNRVSRGYVRLSISISITVMNSRRLSLKVLLRSAPKLYHGEVYQLSAAGTRYTSDPAMLLMSVLRTILVSKIQAVENVREITIFAIYYMLRNLKIE